MIGPGLPPGLTCFSATEFLMTDLAPACRYRFRVRRLTADGGPPSAWSEVLVLETDATDSAHRIDFDDITVLEVLGEGVGLKRATFRMIVDANDVHLEDIEIRT